ncbi:MAG: hypothetical protein ACAI34_03875 [Verrucomicrobium sp.]
MKTATAIYLLASTLLLAQEKATDPFAPDPPASLGSQPILPTNPPQPDDLRPRPETLKLLAEPSLEKLANADQLPAIRLIWVRTFHAPISLRAYMSKDGPRLRVARTSGKGGYDWGKLNFENDFALKQETWQQILNLLYADEAREPFKHKPDARALLSGLDGAIWRLEVVDKSGYTVDEASNPTIATDGKPEHTKALEDEGIHLANFVKLCKFLIQYAPMDEESIY